MISALTAFQISRTEPAYRQISDHLRRLIRAGEFAPGAKLPPTQELAALFGAQVTTIQAAMTPLVKEGLLVRYARKGTFVRRRAEKLTCVGVYYSQDYFTNHASDFLRAVHAALQAQLHRRGIQLRICIDPRPASEQVRPWPELVRAAQDRDIQALIGMAGAAEIIPWLSKLPVPYAHLTNANFPAAVTSDLLQLAELGLRRLAAQGCRSVGLITTLPTDTVQPGRSPHPAVGFFARFIDVARDLGLTVRNEWMRVPLVRDCRGGIAATPYGYREFRKLWRLPRRPAGVIVDDDVTARGVIHGVQMEGVRVPEELQLVLSKNETIDLFCPMPATFAVLRERECAAALIAQIEKQCRGESCAPILVPYRLQPSPAGNTLPSNAKAKNQSGQPTER